MSEISLSLMPKSPRKKFLKAGDAVIGTADEALYASRIARTAAICLWDSKLKVGGMALVVFSEFPGVESKEWFSSGVSPDIALPYLLSGMMQKGSQHRNINLRVIGGEDEMLENILKTAGLLQILKISTLSDKNWRRVKFDVNEGHILIQDDYSSVSLY